MNLISALSRAALYNDSNASDEIQNQISVNSTTHNSLLSDEINLNVRLEYLTINCLNLCSIFKNQIYTNLAAAGSHIFIGLETMATENENVSRRLQ